MKFPYGISDFNKIITQGYFYCDRTDKIPLIEETGSFLLFLRPRRFGKSLLLSMLANYYDVAQKDKFEEIFGNLLISKNPTNLHNKYFILKWDFSCIDSSGNAEDIKKSLYDYINVSIKDFLLYYKDFSIPPIEIDRENAIYSIKSLTSSIRETPYRIYLLIDEYDNFANEVMMGVRKGKDVYEALVYEEGTLKTLFKAVKAFSGESLFDRTFITGVSPVVMSDITSGYNIAENIYLEPEFNELCGFTEKEIENAIEQIADKCAMKQKQVFDTLSMIRVYYNGYSFSRNTDMFVYNPTLALYFLKKLYKNCEYPDGMLDDNLAQDEAKLQYISNLVRGKQLLIDLAGQNRQVVIKKLSGRFGIKAMLNDQSKDLSFMASFLYYFGMLTLAGKTNTGELRLKIPNLVTQVLYIDRIREMLLPEPSLRDGGIVAAKKLYEKGDIQPISDFIEQTVFKVFSTRDYRWANELTVKTAFLTFLYNDVLYIIDSEKPVGRQFTDLTMIIRQDMREFDLFDVLIEFKFLSLKAAFLTGEEARGLTKKELESIPAMQAKLDEAIAKINVYGKDLEQKYGNLRLRKFAVVSLGFERLLTWSES